MLNDHDYGGGGGGGGGNNNNNNNLSVQVDRKHTYKFYMKHFYLKN
jgi:hypothetical protein